MKKTVKIMSMMLIVAMMFGSITASAAQLENIDTFDGDDEALILTDGSYDAAEEADSLIPDVEAAKEDAYDSSSDEADDGMASGISDEAKAKTYTVRFDGNGSSSGKMGDLTATAGQKFKLPKNLFARKGYKFKGWNTKKDGKGKSFENKEKVKDLTSKSSLTLYAQWKKGKKDDFEIQAYNTAGSHGVVFVVKNNTKTHYYISINVEFYKGSQCITSKQDKCDCLQSGAKCALFTPYSTVGGTTQYDGYKVSIQYREKRSKFKCYAKKAKSSYTISKNKKKVNVTLSNLDKDIKNGDVAIVFYKNKKAVSSDKIHLQNGFEPAFKGRSTYKLSFDFPVIDGKTVVPDKCKVYLNRADWAKY